MENNIPQGGLKRKRVFFLTSIIVILTCIISGTYYLGYLSGARETKKIIVEGIASPTSSALQDFSPFWNVWSLIKSDYVSSTAVSDNKSLMYGAIAGMVNAIGDPYTTFFNPTEAKKFTEEISGEFGGIGAEIGMNKNNELVVVAPLQGTPAQKAGLMSQDRIIAIDTMDAGAMTTDEAVSKIRGKKGTTVTLTILRSTWKETKDFPIVRDIIELPTVEFKMLGKNGDEESRGDIAYIKLDNFYEKAPQLFYNALAQAAQRDAKGLIIDLRNNPGGYLNGAVTIAGTLLPKETDIVTEAFRDSSMDHTFTSSGYEVIKNIPITVLINGGSASASEILAGALQDNKRATIMGQKSFGKGTVQEVLPVDLAGENNGMVKITIAHWLTPKGTAIDKNGIEPDIALSQPSEKDYQDNATAAEWQWVVSAAKELAKNIQ